MKTAIVTILTMALASLGLAATGSNDLGQRDWLLLSDLSLNGGQLRIAVEVINDQDLAALDIPIRFGAPGDPITLETVEWTSRVEGWDSRNALIDNADKTVILGLISDLYGKRGDKPLAVSSEGGSRIATLVFRVENDYTPTFEEFVTLRPFHALTYIHVSQVDGITSVEEFRPEVELVLSYKKLTVPGVYALSQAFPNPFNPATSFVLSLPEETDYSVAIFNVVGQVVRRFGGHSKAGEIRITWDGTNEQGSPVASGVYFFRADAVGFTSTRKMVLVR